MSDQPTVALLKTVEVLHAHLTEPLCADAFDQLRTKERRREWTLHRLAEFWTAIILRAPKSLTQALEAASAGAEGWPEVTATPQAFFSRCQDLDSSFFSGVFQLFVDSVIRKEAPGFEMELSGLLDRFTSVWVVDGSRLDAVAHRLKITWADRSVLLPGAITAFYDLFHGFAPQLYFHEDAMEGEQGRVERVLDNVPAGTLLVGDRLYCSVRFFKNLRTRGLFGLSRLKKNIKVSKLEALDKRAYEDGSIEDEIVEAGAERQPERLRLITVRGANARKKIELVTSALDPEQLSAEEVVVLYAKRWSVERMFFDLKEVLNLHCFYAANVNAVAMQVFAAAIVHVAMRVAQGHIARDHGIAAEAISPAKLFPRVAVASHLLVTALLIFQATRKANPGLKLKEPDWSALPGMQVLLRSILVQRRSDKRKKRKFCESRRRARSLPKPRKSGAS